MRCDPQQNPPLRRGLVHQAERSMLEVPQATVDQARRPSARSTGEVGSFHQGGAEPAHGRVARDAGAGDAAAKDKHVDGRPGEFSQGRRPGCG
jgi:hypothetical protein